MLRFKYLSWAAYVLAAYGLIRIAGEAWGRWRDENQRRIDAAGALLLLDASVPIQDAGEEAEGPFDEAPPPLFDQFHRIEARTKLTPGSGRYINIQKAAKTLDRTVLQSGMRFSFNNVIGERSHFNGYVPAESQFYGGTVDTVGGGICQVSTTLYQVLMRAGIVVRSRHNHSQQVEYADPGLDAAVVWEAQDLSFFAPEVMRITAELVEEGGGIDLVVGIETASKRPVWRLRIEYSFYKPVKEVWVVPE